MIKSYAEKDNKYLMHLFEFSNKFIYYSLLVIGLPLIFEMEFILSVWLKEISSDMVIFTQLIVVFAILLALHNPVTIIMQATGKVKKYFLYVESFTLLSMPFTYVAFKLGFPASSTFVVMIIVFALAHLIRLIILKLNAEWFRIKDYMVSFVVPALLITAFATVCTLLMRNFVDNQIAKFVCVVLVAIVSIVVPVLCFALNRQEKQLLKMLIHR
jgi:O-antigen/teichoic acid export membrane protein